MSDPLLRVATPDDGAELARIYAPIVRDTAISFELQPPDADELAARVRAASPRWPWLLACEPDDPARVLGYAYAGVFRGRPAYRFSCEAAIYVDARARRRGLGRRLYGALLGALRRQGLRRVVAGIALPNDPSERLHEGLGFVHAGTTRRIGFKAGRWHDVAFWTLDLGPPDAPPDGEPRDFAAQVDEKEHLRWQADARRVADGGMP